jgi:protein O-mannosyl-transferase
MKSRNRSQLDENAPAASLAESAAAGAPSAWMIALALGIIAMAAVAAYCNSFSGPFIFDDRDWVVENPNVWHLWPIWPVLFPPDATSGGGRPVINLTLAINYALGGLNVWGYHAVNLAIHILAAWALFGVVRRTLSLPPLRERFGSAAIPLALATAVLWAVHPLQTESVTYIIQRSEAMAGLFYLLALYSVIRGSTSQSSTRWYVTATAACLLGMATKEVVATAPVIVLLYDRTFLAGSFREAWRRRYGLYLALAATWSVVAGLLISTGFRGGTTGFAIQEFTWRSYLLSQPGVIVNYLRLTFWPAGLCLDYGWPVARTLGDVLLPGILVVGMLVLTLWALVKRPAWGFLGAWFFVILAPTSSFVPIKDIAFEHRMYLSLAALIAGLVIGGWMAIERLVGRGTISRLASRWIGGALVVLVGVGLGAGTFHRNKDYRSDLAIWEDTENKAPGNERAHNNLGVALTKCGRFEEAIVHYQKALELKRDNPETHNNFGVTLADCGQLDEAIAHYRKSLEIKPDYAQAHNNLGAALAKNGRVDEAMAEYQKALELKPEFTGAYNNVGLALDDLGRVDEAIACYRKALELDPGYADAHYNLGLALAKRGRLDEAIAEYQKALQIKPDYAEFHNNLGAALGRSGRCDEAIAHFQQALEIRPGYADARSNLAIARSQREELVKSLAGRRESLRSHPDDVALLNDTAWMLATDPNASIRNGAEAVGLAERAAQLSGRREPAVLGTLAAAYAEAGRFAEAVQTAHKALERAAQQDQQKMVESIKVKIPFYEAGTPFHQKQQLVPSNSVRP